MVVVDGPWLSWSQEEEPVVAVLVVLACFLRPELLVLSALYSSRKGFKEVSSIVEKFGSEWRGF